LKRAKTRKKNEEQIWREKKNSHKRGERWLERHKRKEKENTNNPS